MKATDVLIVIGSLQVGGAEMHIAMIAPALQKLGWSVAVYSLGGYGPLYERLERQGVRVILPPNIRRWQDPIGLFMALQLVTMVLHLLTTMLRRRPALVHFFLPEAYLIGGFLAALARLPIRVMSRRSLNIYSQHRPWIRAMEIRLHRTMTAILGNSRSVVHQLRDVEHVPAERLGLIYNGIDTEALYRPHARAAIRTALGLLPETAAMITVGNLIPYKGHRDLFAALQLCGDRLPTDWRLLVVGRDDGIGAELRRDAAAAFGEKIMFLGERRDIAELLSACDIGLLCSHQEGFSNAVLEGMASGLPMIVTDVGGNSEAVIHGECGLVVPAEDPPQLARAIERLVGDPELRARFGAAARARSSQEFSLEQCVARYDRFYRALRTGSGLGACPDLQVWRGELESGAVQRVAPER